MEHEGLSLSPAGEGKAEERLSLRGQLEALQHERGGLERAERVLVRLAEHAPPRGHHAAQRVARVLEPALLHAQHAERVQRVHRLDLHVRAAAEQPVRMHRALGERRRLVVAAELDQQLAHGGAQRRCVPPQVVESLGGFGEPILLGLRRRDGAIEPHLGDVCQASLLLGARLATRALRRHPTAGRQSLSGEAAPQAGRPGGGRGARRRRVGGGSGRVGGGHRRGGGELRGGRLSEGRGALVHREHVVDAWGELAAGYPR